MVNITELTKLANKKGMILKLHEKRKQLSGTGVIWDLDVGNGCVTRVKIAEYRNPLSRSANVYFNQSSKRGIDFKTESELVRFMHKYN